LGAVIGAVALPVLTFAGIAVFGPGGLVVGPLAWLVVGVALMFGKSNRPWGLGILIGGFGMLVILGGACVAILASLNAADG
jgi:hypothetical protein